MLTKDPQKPENFPVSGSRRKTLGDAADLQSKSETAIMYARAALALFGMGSMRTHQADLISL